MKITKEMLEYFAEDNASIYSFERSAKAPGKNVEYEEIQSPDSDEPVYMWAENKMGQCRVMYYSEAYNIEMDLSAYPFSKSKSLVIVELPEGLTEIPGGMFKDCSVLVQVVIPESMKEIGDFVFENCSSLKTVEIPDAVENIGVYAFHNSGLQEVVLPSSLKCVERSTFYKCKELASVTLNEGLEEIGEAAFSGMAITELVMPSTLKKIGRQAFAICSNLTVVSLNEGLENIEPTAFWGCYNIAALSLPSTLKTLGDGAFEAKVVGGQLPEGLETISGRLNENTKINSNFVMDENGVIFNKDKTALLATTKDIEGEYRIPDGVVSIGYEAFMHQTISGIVWNQELETIGFEAFLACNKLISVPPVPTGVKKLNGTFEVCKNLKEVIVPGTVESLNATFWGCENLTSVTLEEGIKEIDKSTFDGCEKLQNLVYPKGAQIVK